MRPNRPRLAMAVVVAGVAGLVLPTVPHPAQAATHSAGHLGAGCRTAPAETYRPGQPRPLATPPAPPPVPCLVGTGFGGSETQVAVTKDGTVVYEPAILTPGLAGTAYAAGAPGPQPSTQVSPGGLSLSANLGATWRFDAPAGATWVPQDDALYVDRTTGRIFYYALSPDPIPDSGSVPVQSQAPAGYASLMTSGNDGRTWAETALPGYFESENPRFTSAPPPAGRPVPSNYPDVVYWCGNNVVKAGLPLPSYRACYRSLDAGRSWELASILTSYPLPQHSQCGTNGEDLNDGDPNYPEGAPDGSLYAEVNCGSSTFLARSADEGATWPLVTDARGAPVLLPADGELRVASDGSLFLVYQTSPSQIVMRRSTTGGRTWSAATQVTPAGLGPISEWAVAERGKGLLALSLLVERGSTSVYDGYLIYSRQANVTDPVLWAAELNPSAAPLRTSDPPPARDDFIGVDIGPTGTPWASFAASCPGPAGPTAACAGQASDPEANQAVAGRLAWPGRGSPTSG